VAAGIASRSSQTEALTFLTCFLPTADAMLLWRSSVGKHLGAGSYQSIRPSHAAGLPAWLGPLWVTVTDLFLYHHEPQFSPIYGTKGSKC